MSRDVEADYRRAYLEQYQRARRAGRTDEADHLAVLLRTRFGHNVEPDVPPRPDTDTDTDTQDPPPRRGRAPKNRASASPLPETTVGD
ncbi:hypothetical protein [Nocardia altamirensis]|uniref:hypothetical protein n=1 Tax=Nocardia altamirensis TaxID=472158 RepID=UPI00083FF8BD|nr:hypothetical protein [Nocardia altamirensis]